MSEFRSPDPTTTDIRRGYDGTRVKVRGFVWFVFFFILFVGATLVLVWYTVKGMTAFADAGNNERYPPSPLTARVVMPPEPNLQPSKPQVVYHGRESIDWQDMAKLRDVQQASLTAKGWDKSPRTGRLVVPQRILEQVAAGILQSRGGAPTTQSSGTVTPGATGSADHGVAGSAGTTPGGTAHDPTPTIKDQPGRAVPGAPGEPAHPDLAAPAATQPATQPGVQPEIQPGTQPVQPATQPAVGGTVKSPDVQLDKQPEKEPGTEPPKDPAPAPGGTP